MKSTETAGGVVVNPEGKVLVVSQQGKSWSLPKGHIEAGEDQLSAARREIYEEAGITDLTLIKSLGSYQRHKISHDGDGDDRSELKTLYFFLFTTTQIELRPVDKSNPEARWVNIDEVTGLLTHQKDKEFFENIKGEIS